MLRSVWLNQDYVWTYTPNDFAPTTNVAIFSLLNTLIIDISYKGKIKWKYLHDNVPDILRSIASKGSIAIIENTHETEKIKQMFTEVCEDLKISMVGLFSYKYNKYRKPHTHIFDKLDKIYSDRSVKINKKISLVCGNAAGRLREGKYKADSSDYDRAFAKNIGISFVSERMFNGQPEKNWEWSNRLIDVYVRRKYLKLQQVEPDIIKQVDLMESRAHLILLMGAPASGKSLLMRRIIDDWKSRKGSELHILLEKSKASDLDSHLDKRESVIIEGGFSKSVTRKKFINVAVKNGVPVIIVNLITPNDLCVLLSHIRVETQASIKKSAISLDTINKYYRGLQNPHEDLWKHSVDITKLICIDYPMVIRERAEYWLQY